MFDEPRITLCIIARNEAANLPGCLDSVRGIVDAIVVVDTGSTDDTVRIAKEAGATVVNFPWVDDFAAARNAALPYVRSGFILVLDADERLAPGAQEPLRAALLDPLLDCGMLPLHDAPSEDAHTEQALATPATLLPRLLRVTPDLQWRGRIHESVGAWIEQRRDRARLVAAPILHYGAIPDVRARLGKSERNIGLLRRRIVDEPHHPSPRAFLAQELLLVGRTDEARAEISAAWELLVRAWEPEDGTPPSFHPPAVGILQRHVGMLLERNEFEAASDAVARVIGWIGDDHPVVRFLRGRIEELAGDSSDDAARRAWWVRAMHSYRTVAQAHGIAYAEPVPPTMTGAGACERLAVVLLKLQEAEHARAVAEGAVDLYGMHDGLRCALAEAAVRSRDPARALAALGFADGAPLDTPDAWALAADAFAQQGDTARAADALRRAVVTPSWSEPHRVDRVIRLAEALGI
jgi:glycosyltransferase involved in cell wall biosynthesis